MAIAAAQPGRHMARVATATVTTGTRTAATTAVPAIGGTTARPAAAVAEDQAPSAHPAAAAPLPVARHNRWMSRRVTEGAPAATGTRTLQIYSAVACWGTQAPGRAL